MASREVLLMRKLFEDHETEQKRDDSEEDEDCDNRLLVVDYGEWEREQKACREGRKVVALEITDPFTGSCARIRPHFARLAKEFDSYPFIRVLTGPPPFITIDKVCSLDTAASCTSQFSRLSILVSSIVNLCC